jgi:hypothetical protein
VAKTLLDTAKLENQSVSLVLYKVASGRKSRLGSTNLKSSDYSQDIPLATLNNKVLGGHNYLSIEWQVRGKDEKGSIEPFGIVILDSGLVDTVTVAKHRDELDIAKAGQALSESDFKDAENQSFAMVWSKKNLGIVCKKSNDSASITFCFDGKNGKNAFLSYPDRFITYMPQKDSLHTYHFTRRTSDTGVVYIEKTWINDITMTSDNDLVMVLAPWYDLGIIPFNGRRFGFAVFSGNSEVPSNAKREIPGTWGDAILIGGPESDNP